MRVGSAALVVLAPALASAYAINQTPLNLTVRWNKMPIPYYLTSQGSSDVSDASDTNAVLASFADWEAVTCSKLAFVQKGTTPNVSVLATGAQPNDKSEVVWVEDSSWDFGNYVLGVTSPLSYVDGTIFEADIAFNGYSTNWSTTGKFNTSDVKSVAIHEIGHMFGLQHNLCEQQGYDCPFNGNDPPTMAPAADPYGKTASLHADDKSAACFLYPTGALFNCGSDDECPFVLDNANNGEEYYTTKLLCSNGFCAYDTQGKAPMGDPCDTSEDCAAPLFCQPVENTQYCTHYCYEELDNCEEGFDCYPYQGDTLGACVGQAPAKKSNGQACTASTECASALCFTTTSGKACRQGCTNDAGCSGGLVCYLPKGGSISACVPKSEVPVTSLPTGSACNLGTECDSGHCVVTPGTEGPPFCRDACSDGACGTGLTCVAVSGADVCVPGQTSGAGGVGAACDAAADCDSGVCYGGSCVTGCLLGASDCSAGRACQRMRKDDSSGYCELSGAGAVGDTCVSDTDCETRFCEDAGEGLACQQPCTASHDPCPSGRVCAALLGLSELRGCLPGGGADGADGADAATSDGADAASDGTDGAGDGNDGTTDGRRRSGCDPGARPSAPWTALGALALLALRRRNAGCR